MADDPFYRIDTTKLYPPFLAKLRQALAVAQAQGFYYVATCGYRDYADQTALYAKGRTAPGPKVTDAVPWQSYHCYGLAVDFARDLDPSKPGLQGPGYSDADMKPLADAAKAVGLQPGLYFATIHDVPHIQFDCRALGVWLLDLKQHLEQSGLPAVWAFLDGKQSHE